MFRDRVTAVYQQWCSQNYWSQQLLSILLQHVMSHHNSCCDQYSSKQSKHMLKGLFYRGQLWGALWNGIVSLIFSTPTWNGILLTFHKVTDTRTHQILDQSLETKPKTPCWRRPLRSHCKIPVKPLVSMPGQSLAQPFRAMLPGNKISPNKLVFNQALAVLFCQNFFNGRKRFEIYFWGPIDN